MFEWISVDLNRYWNKRLSFGLGRFVYLFREVLIFLGIGCWIVVVERFFYGCCFEYNWSKVEFFRSVFSLGFLFYLGLGRCDI